MHLVGIKTSYKSCCDDRWEIARSRVMVVYCLTDVGGNTFPPPTHKWYNGGFYIINKQFVILIYWSLYSHVYIIYNVRMHLLRDVCCIFFVQCCYCCLWWHIPSINKTMDVLYCANWQYDIFNDDYNLCLYSSHIKLYANDIIIYCLIVVMVHL